VQHTTATPLLRIRIVKSTSTTSWRSLTKPTPVHRGRTCHMRLKYRESPLWMEPKILIKRPLSYGPNDWPGCNFYY